MEDKNETVLRAGLVLRKMRELAEQADAKQERLKQIQGEAQVLQEKWHVLMQSISRSPQDPEVRPPSPTSAVARALLEALLRRRLHS